MKPSTSILHMGRNPELTKGSVNPPIYQTSTLLFPRLQDYDDANKGLHFYDVPEACKVDPSYAITGTDTTFAFAQSIAKLEGADSCLIFPSGLLAITMTILAFAKTGDHVLIPDSVYGPTRRFCNKELGRLGIEATFYDPLLGEDITSVMKDNTVFILTESPGSLTFEVQDIPALVKAAKAKNEEVVIAIDNSWGTPLFLRPFELGLDLSIQAATKYINGHSDLLMGTVSGKEPYITKVFRAYKHYGVNVSPHECYMALRGLRTMATRLARHQESAIKVATWLEGRKEVKRVIYPALPSHPQHEIWKRDFSGACGLFSIILHPVSYESLCDMINGLQLFGIGASWGGYESLATTFDPKAVRTATNWEDEGKAVRLHIGLEDPDDLIEDLEKGLGRL